MLQSKVDSSVSKGISTYKTKFETEDLPKLIDTEVQKRHPAMTEEQKRIKELEIKFEGATKASTRAEMSGKLIRYATEKNIYRPTLPST